MAGSFVAGWLIPADDTLTADVIFPDVTDKNENENTEVTDNALAEEGALRNVFFSPKTGSDETGNGSQGAPFETLEKAKEYAKTLTLAENETICYLEFLMSVDVRTMAAAGVSSSKGGINMIPFTGSTEGAYFTGEIVGQGCDTQKYNMGSPVFSARYLIKGKDYTGQSCSIYIENSGDALDKCSPMIITDSRALAEWQDYDLRAIVTPIGTGVIVDMYRIH